MSRPRLRLEVAETKNPTCQVFGNRSDGFALRSVLRNALRRNTKQIQGEIVGLVESCDAKRSVTADGLTHF